MSTHIPGFPDFANFSSGPRRQPTPKIRFKKPGPLGITLMAIVLVGVFIKAMASVWTEVLWFDQIGYLPIWLTKWGSAAAVGVLAFVVAALIMGVNTRTALLAVRSQGQFRLLPTYATRLVFWLATLGFGLFGAVNLAPNWAVLRVATNSSNFGTKDSIWGFDLSFFTFKLPAVALVVNALLWAVIFGALVALVIYYVGGAVTAAPKVRVSRPARIHMGISAGIISLLVSVNYIVGRFIMISQQGRPTDGALYSDVNATLPANTILAVIAAVIAVLFFVAAFKGSWHLPVAGIATLVVSALVIGVGYPLLIQRFKVEPNARAMEAPYIQRNIDATLAAYGLRDLEYNNYTAKTSATQGQLRDDTASTSQIRLLDPQIISPTVRQLQQSRTYYSFPEQLSVDRYTINNEKRDTVIAVREVNLDGLSKEQRTWVNDHTVYTHGFGVVAAYGNKVTVDGLPAYWEQSIEKRGEMGNYEPRVYFSANAPQYSIVGAPKGADPQELDYPDDKAKSGQVNNTFAGKGGPSVGNLWNKLLFAIKFRSTDLFFSDQVNKESQILYDRDPSLRVAKVAPYLTLDRKPYPAVVDMDGNPKTPKRLVWIVDGYTTLDSYPYAQHVSLEGVTTDSRTSGEDLYSPYSRINYMRNSVKAVVDSYDGSVTLYQWDKQDPVLKTWTKVFPAKVKPLSEISGDLMAHLRYPEDYFKVQRKLLETYHVTNAPQFYTGGDRWRLSEDPTASKLADGSSPVQPPYYLTMKMPGQETAEFSLNSVFIPGGGSKRAAMAGFLAVDSETGNQKGKVREGYGKLRLMALPSATTVPGPGQVQNNFNSDSAVSKELNLQDQQGTKVLRGNLLTLPVGGGLLYVQPIYVQSTGSTSYPQLRSVLTAFGDKIGFASTLEESLDQVFGGDAGSKTETTIGGTKEDVAAKTQTLTAEQELQQALTAAKTAMEAADKALKAGDWSGYGKAQKDLNEALQKALSAQDKADKSKTAETKTAKK
ncbi:MAG: UPF0182 family protein [Actinomycetaceae bacterium]|nr:UPF0182 family protein [Actinomycetaceae bacterium]